MKMIPVTILKKLGIYHPLQSAFRNSLFIIRRFYNRIAYSKYRGAGFTCNVCSSEYSRFIDDYPNEKIKGALERHNVIAGFGKNIFCPFCLSTARERLVLLYLQEKIYIENKTILHLAPEKYVYQFLKKKASVTTADITPGYYRDIDKFIIRQDICNLSFEDNFFDVVIANHILEHIPDDRKAISEIFRVLKNGGTAIMQVPYSKTIPGSIEDPGIHNAVLQEQKFGQKDHVRIYSLNDYLERLKNAGFMIYEIKYHQNSEYYKYAIQKGESFLLIEKP